MGREWRKKIKKWKGEGRIKEERLEERRARDRMRRKVGIGKGES